MNSQSIKIFIGLVLIIVFILSANLISGILFPDEPVNAPQFIPDTIPMQSPHITVSHSFPFESTIVSLSFPVNVSTPDGTTPAGRVTSVSRDDSGPGWIEDRYRSMVMDPASDQVFSDLLEELDKIRGLQVLSDDEYLELLAVYVQSLRYESLEQNPAKYPIETIRDGAGDCDDKSLLLAGLLAREGYSVALLSFGPEAHMAVGVGSNGYLYKKTGYAFLETTNYSFVGVPADTLGSNLTLFSDPTIIVINKGEKLYRCGHETRFINDNYITSDQKVKELGAQLKRINDDLMSKRIRIDILDSQISQLRTSGNIGEYNSHVLTYSTLISIYNSRLDFYRELHAEYETYAEVHNYIFHHKYDRKGVYNYIRQNMPS